MLERTLLTPDTWGFVGVNNVTSPLQTDPQIYLSSNFDAVDTVRFTSDTHVHDAYCFGMDEFFINEIAPPRTDIPEPSTIAILALGLFGLASRQFIKRR